MKVICFKLLLVVFLASMQFATYSQENRKPKRAFKSIKKKRFKYTVKNPAKLCALIARNQRKSPPKVKRYSWRLGRSKSTTANAGVSNDVPTTKLAKFRAEKSNDTLQDQPTSSFDAESLDEKHNIEDEVLSRNNLPAPTSAEHERIRTNVEEHLKTKKDGEPLSLESLFFVTGQDEFAMVDMEPFLVAVEYALQGKTVLIEGHSDSIGNDKSNVDLSMKRVERIRQLMLQMGVPDERISVVGYGEEIGKYDNSTVEGREKNRRVDFTVF